MCGLQVGRCGVIMSGSHGWQLRKRLQEQHCSGAPAMNYLGLIIFVPSTRVANHVTHGAALKRGSHFEEGKKMLVSNCLVLS